MLIGFSTDKGRNRASNQDSGVASSEGHFLAVADGLGGHSGGAEASNTAIGLFNMKAAGIRSLDDMKAFMEEANSTILRKADEDPELKGMGTTMTAAVIEEGKALIAHVGDSRAYLVRDGSAKQLTLDHSLAGQLVQSGFLKAEEASTHPGRYAVVRCLGASSELEPQLIETDLKPNDVLVFCTDGFWEHVNEVEIAERFSTTADLMSVCEDLMRLANIRGGEDNITVVAALIDESDVR
ncbi:MAG TPA: protein phosphatase 2C domain-containing protein [Bacillota bacterium]|nr:protein phosphatase 2C domain-containing protein [Bacillota bacterium]HOH10764.1 protein phosphatase 2C domain-containing protein [Bacillota bacterium]HPI01344.1 protein phosphatase 2C domain-containing protein [Bacillota bacterium]HPM63613.1 protein phosphatase 2C domain-containing protein [Bacillota bacterium]